MRALGVARCGLSLTPPVMCEHVRGWHQATPMFSNFRELYSRTLARLHAVHGLSAVPPISLLASCLFNGTWVGHGIAEPAITLSVS